MWKSQTSRWVISNRTQVRFAKRFSFIAALSLRIHRLTRWPACEYSPLLSPISLRWRNNFRVFTLAIRPTFVKESLNPLIWLLYFPYPNLRDLSGSLTTNRTARWGVWVWSWRDFHAHQGRSCFQFSLRGGAGIFIFQLLLNKPGIKERILFYLRKSRWRTVSQFEYQWQDWYR